MARGDSDLVEATPQTVATDRHAPSRRPAAAPAPNTGPHGTLVGPPAAVAAPVATPSVPPLRAQVGQVLAGRYLVTGVVGEGGMGIVYRCRDRHGGAEVAVKRVVPPEGRLAEDYITWFYKEARALASLSHPNIVDARDFGRLDDGSPYLAMELVKGLSLHDYSNARLSFPIIWSLVDQILGALAHAHSRRVIHGDLKPSNIIVEEQAAGAPKVHILDFGLAWLKEDPHDERLDGEKAMEFEPHAGAGTPGYMAPEQIMHEMHHVCGATDLYSLACILYKLLGGRAPFSGDPKELLKAHAYEEPPPARPVNRVPEGVVGFVTLCMKKRPWDRFEFAAEARRAWAAFQPAEDVDPRLYRLPVVAGPTQANAAPSLTDVTTPKLDDATRRKSVPAPGDKAHGLLSIRPTPMVGRTSVRDHLLAACADMVANRGPAHRLTLLIGPAGVGKSRIAEWLTSVVHEDGRMVPLTVRYRRIRGSSDGMLGAITQHFNFERADRTTIERSLMARWSVSSQDTKMRTWVAATAEWLRPHDPGSDTVGPSGLRVTLDTLEARRRVIRFVLRRIAGGRPLLFFLDDLHNAAQTTLEGLLRIHATESDQRILMAATVRAEDVQLGTLTAERISRLQEQMGGEVIHIDPLDRDTTAQLLRAAIPLEESAVVEATRRSRGSPLFALQQLHAWAHAGDFQFENGVYRVPSEVLAVRPKTTADLWESRLATLAPQHQLAGYAVSTLGLDIRRTVLKAMVRELGLNADEVIVSLQNAEIILPRGPGRYNWAHALLQEHLFRKLSERPDSRRVFVAAAEALKAHPLANTRRVVRQRCINLLYASEPESAAGVFFHFLEQGWHGSRQPVESLTDLDLFRDRLRGTPQGIALRWRAEALRQLGRTEEATRYATQALQLLGNAEDPIALAHCQRILGGLKCEQGDFESGTSLLQAALQAFQLQKNAPGMAQCEYALGQVELSLGRHEHARGFARLGDAHFAGANDPLGRGHCLLLLGAVERADGAIERARQLTIEARTEFERSGDQLGQAETTLALALCEHRLSNFFSADRGAAEALSLFESLKIARGRAACERLLAMVAIDTDNVERGGEHAERAEQLYSELRDPFGVVECRLLRAQASLVRRDFAEARRAIMQAREIGLREPEPRQHYLLTRAWFQLENGDSDSAQEALNAAPTVFAKAWQVGGHTLHLLTRLTRLAWPVPETINDIQEWRRVIQERAKSDIQK